jgi:hypothetical protein
MAGEKIAIEIEISGEQKTLSTLKDIKKARKDLTEAALLGDSQAINSLKKLEDKFGDLQDSAKAVRGDGLEPLKNSFDLFKEGISNFDLGKIGTAFKGLGAAMKAVPIFLLVEGITYLITNFKELSEGTGILAKVLQPVGDLISWITDGLYALTDAIGLTNSELDKMSEAATENATKAQEALALQNAEYDRQIAISKSAGKSTVDAEKAKQQAIIETNRQIVEQQIALIRAGAIMDEERKKLITTSLEAIKNAKTQEIVIENTAEQAKIEKAKKTAEEKKKIKDQELDEERKKNDEALATLDAFLTAGFQANVNFAQAKVDYNKEVDRVLDEQAAEKAAEKKRLLEKEDADILASLEKRKQGYKEFEAQKFELTKQSIEAIRAVSDLVFAHQLTQARGNLQKEREIKKKQFNLNKALGIASATIDGVQAVQKALNNPYPLNIVLAVLSGALAAANVVKIATTKFDDGGGAASADTGGLGNIGGAAAPVVQSPNNTVTKIDDNGKIEDAKKQEKVQVVEVGDINEKQKRVKTIEEAATL